MVEVPARRAKPGWVLVQTAASLVSVSTERQPLDLARKSFFGKALARPDLVREVVTKAVAEGIGEVWRQALGLLNVPIPLGYSSAGTVFDVEPQVQGIAVGDRVACAGRAACRVPAARRLVSHAVPRTAPPHEGIGSIGERRLA